MAAGSTQGNTLRLCSLLLRYSSPMNTGTRGREGGREGGRRERKGEEGRREGGGRGREEGGGRERRDERRKRVLSDVLFPQVELEKYDRGVRWLREVLFNVKFTKERLLVVATKMMNDVARYGIVEGGRRGGVEGLRKGRGGG